MTPVQEELNFTGICTLFHICSWYSFRGSVLHDGLLYGLLHHLHGLAAHGLDQAVHSLGLMVHGLRLAVHGLGLAVCLAVQGVLVDHLAVQETPVDELEGLLFHGLRRAVLWVVGVLGGVLHLLGSAVQCLLDGGVLAVVVVVSGSGSGGSSGGGGSGGGGGGDGSITGGNAARGPGGGEGVGDPGKISVRNTCKQK